MFLLLVQVSLNIFYLHKSCKWESYCYYHSPVVSSFLMYHRVCSNSNTTGTISGAGSACLSGAFEFILVLFVAQSLVFCVDHCLYLSLSFNLQFSVQIIVCICPCLSIFSFLCRSLFVFVELRFLQTLLTRWLLFFNDLYVSCFKCH